MPTFRPIDIIPGTQAARSTIVDVIQNPGAIEYNGALYILTLTSTSSTATPANTTHLNVYKSTDLGITWVAKDQANGQLLVVNAYTSDGYWDGSSNILYCAYFLASGFQELRLARFDLDTETWVGSAITGGPDAYGFAWHHLKTVEVAGSQWVVYHTRAPGAIDRYNSLYAVEYNGSWQTPILIKAGISGPPSIGSMDVEMFAAALVGTRIYILYASNYYISFGGTFNAFTLDFNSLDTATDTLSGEQNWVAERLGAGYPTRVGQPKYDAAANELNFAWVSSPSFLSGTEFALVVIEATTLVITIDPVGDPLPTDNWTGAALAYDLSNNLHYFVDNFTDFGAWQILEVIRTGGVWSAVTVWWDSTIDPLQWPGAVAETIQISADYLSDGTVRLTVGANIPDPFLALCGIMFINGPDDPPPPSGNRRILPQYIKRRNFVGH